MPTVAQSPSGVRTQDQLLAHSGLDFMLGILNGTLPPAPIAAVLDYSLHAVSDGAVTFRGTPDVKSTNPMGTVHGGWYGTLLDSAMGCAVMTKVPRGAVYTTLEYKINLVRSIPLGTSVDCVGVVTHSGRSTAVATGEIRGTEDGKLYATGSTTCIIMQLA